MNRQILQADLWDSIPIGRPIHLCLCYDELLSPQIILDEKVFHSSTYFIGTLEYDDESQRLTYVIDGNSITNEINHHQLLTGEFLIPILHDSRYSTIRNNWIQNAMKEIDLYCRSSEPVELHRFLYLSARMSSIDLSFDLLTIKNSFTLTPINPNYIQIVPTSLLKNLNSATRNSNYNNGPRFGYCSLDRMLNNRILLILENDPQVCVLPIIGIWVSGIVDIQCAFVWTVCLRYCFNSSLKNRLRSGMSLQQSFLLVGYSPTSHDQCTFYEVCLKSSSTIDYDVWTCSKQISALDSTTQLPYDFQFQRVYNQSNDYPETEISMTFSSPNTNESLYGIPRIPLTQLAAYPSSIADNRWKDEFIERMKAYESQIQSLTALVTQLLTAQQNSVSPPKRDVGVQTSLIPADPNSVDILKPIFSFLDNRQHVTSTTTTGISFISNNGIQMQLINQQSSTTTVYP